MSRSASSTWLAACAAGLALASGAAAQDPTGIAPPPEVPDQIEVIGTHIPRPNLEGVGPVTIVDAAAIEASGLTSINELIRTLPSVGTQGVSRNNNNGGNGVAFVDLRNLEASRTLVLINGRRAPITSVGDVASVDLNNIPTQLVERVEILRDGASALYGSDAVAGVVNFVLKDEIDGLELDVFGGMSEERDGQEGSISLTGGRNFGAGHLIFNATWLDQAEVNQRNRFWSRNEIINFNSEGKLQFGLDQVPEGKISSADYYFPVDGMVSDFPFDEPGLGPRYDFVPHQYLLAPSSRAAYNLLGSYDFGDSAEAYFHTSYAERDSQQRLAPTAIGSPGTDFFVPFDRLADSAGLSDADRATFFQNLVDANLVTTESDPVPLLRRLTEVGPRKFDQEARVFRFMAGVRGELAGISSLGVWNWDAYANYGRTDTTLHVKNSINLERANTAADPDACAGDPLCPGVADFTGQNSLDAGTIRYISYNERDQLRFHLRNVGVTTSGPVLELPAGLVQMALGAEYREEGGFLRPDPRKISGESANTREQPTRGDYSTRDLFWELEVPLVSGLPAVEEFTVNLAGRLTDFSTFGSDYTYRYAVSWAPVASLRFRGVTSTSFRAPNVRELFGGATDDFPLLDDPCNGVSNTSDPVLLNNCALAGVTQLDGSFNQANAQIVTRIGGSPDLQAETSTFWGLGLVWTPEFIPDLSLTVDYYDIEIDSAISNPSPAAALANCYTGAPDLSSPSCDRISRNQFGQIQSVGAVLENIGKTETNGIDFTLSYGFNLPLLGDVNVTGSGTYLFDFVETTRDGVIKRNGTITFNDNSYANFRASLTSTFQPVDSLFLTMGMRYIGRADDPGLAGTLLDDVPEVWYMDASLRYDFNETWSATLGIRNLTDKNPPRMYDFGNSNANTYDYMGRFGYARLNAKF